MSCWEIRIEGIVQGVGFRPHVYQLAHRMDLKGTVSNGAEGVHIQFEASPQQAEIFYRKILAERPAISRITHHRLQPLSPQFFEDFQIIESEAAAVKKLPFTPDYGLCSDCRSEMKDANDRRFQYPFITCTQCGPRYSIITDLPYDRPWTTMQPFEMCPTCQAEYDDPMARRHFSQTNSCAECGITLKLLEEGNRVVEGNNPTIKAAILKAWEEGKIIAIKGIGGFLLTCDASNPHAIAVLRQRKQRPSKPFALMYPSVENLDTFSLDDSQKARLQGPVSPIVLLPRGPDFHLTKGIADGLSEVGVMLPYAPLFEWLLDAYQKPIVATSGNISHSPIIYREEKMGMLWEVADCILTHNRAIVVPQDDSVVRISPTHRQQIILRRSRGWAPNYFPSQMTFPQNAIFAAGAHMKSSIGLLHEGNVYISQYLGSLSHFDTEKTFSHVRKHLEKVLGSQPEVILHDLHPQYASTRLAQDLAEERNLPSVGIQHHEAHFAAILGENELLHTEDPVLGIIWDGTGYGTDGQVWGGEFLTWRNREMIRVAHLDYFPVLGGDKMAREPRMAALSILPEASAIHQKFTSTEWKLLQAWRKRSPLQTSSMGRLFDAVASVLNIVDVQSFEGEAAMKLEAMARTYWNGEEALSSYNYRNEKGDICPRIILQEVLGDKKRGNTASKIAAQFHFTLIQIISQIATDQHIQQLAFSGGVFQNALLVDMCHSYLSKEYRLFFHQQLSPNDENISFGQLVHYLIQQEKM
ncbi:MAG: carbamoyltransferase HypF [Bacteroidota bacterium]